MNSNEAATRNSGWINSVDQRALIPIACIIVLKYVLALGEVVRLLESTGKACSLSI